MKVKKFSHTESEGERGTSEVGDEVVDAGDSEEDGDDEEVVQISEEPNENQRVVAESEKSGSVKELEISEELTITTRL
jgi:hypothetical protein